MLVDIYNWGSTPYPAHRLLDNNMTDVENKALQLFWRAWENKRGVDYIRSTMEILKDLDMAELVKTYEDAQFLVDDVWKTKNMYVKTMDALKQFVRIDTIYYQSFLKLAVICAALNYDWQPVSGSDYGWTPIHKLMSREEMMTKTEDWMEDRRILNVKEYHDGILPEGTDVLLLKSEQLARYCGKQ